MITKWRFMTTFLAAWYMVGGQETRRSSSIFLASDVITGAYIVVYAISVYILL